VFLLLQYPFGKWALKWHSMAKKLDAKIRFNRLVRTKPLEINKIKERRAEIIKLIIT
jgi:hypothetical protein